MARLILPCKTSTLSKTCLLGLISSTPVITESLSAHYLFAFILLTFSVWSPIGSSEKKLRNWSAEIRFLELFKMSVIVTFSDWEIAAYVLFWLPFMCVCLFFFCDFVSFYSHRLIIFVAHSKLRSSCAVHLPFSCFFFCFWKFGKYKQYLRVMK